MYDWLLFLHVLAATLFLGIAVAFWAVVLATRPGAPVLSARAAALVTAPLGIVIGAASVAALIFGVWLAIYVDGYELWDAWVAASLALWLVAGGVGARSGRAFTAVDPRRRSGAGVDRHADRGAVDVRARRLG